jgi:hypothetical protein
MNLDSVSTPFVVIGGVATWLYMPRRPTDDVDVLVAAEDAPTLYEELTAAGWTPVGSLTIGGTSWRAPEGGELDVIESSEAWVRDALANPARSPTGLPVISLPYLVLMKLQAARSRDMGDLSRMLGQADEAALEQVRAVVGTHSPTDLADLESLITLGRLEFETP